MRQNRNELDLNVGVTWRKVEKSGGGETWGDSKDVKHLGSQGSWLQALEESSLERKCTWWARVDWLPSTLSRIRKLVQVPQLGFIMCLHMHAAHEDSGQACSQADKGEIIRFPQRFSHYCWSVKNARHAQHQWDILTVKKLQAKDRSLVWILQIERKEKWNLSGVP